MSEPRRPAGRADARRRLARDLSRLARRDDAGTAFWRSLSLVGTVGWTIAVPAAGGALLGHYLDGRLGTGIACTLALLGLGVVAGAAGAWRALAERTGA